MTRHLRLECGTARKYQCPFCPAKCKRNNQLKAHISTKHSVDIKLIPESDFQYETVPDLNRIEMQTD